MYPSKYRKNIEKLLNFAEIEINGSNPWDITVHNENMYERVLAHGSLGLGESYMDGWWDCERLDQFIYRVLSARLDKKIRKNFQFFFEYCIARMFNRQAGARTFAVGKHHYDIGNDLFTMMLDKYMCYSCAYWKKETETIDQAQKNKMELICRKIDLRPGMDVLDIGCGWGGFARYAAEKYQARVTGITVSQQQVNLGRHFCKGLDVDIRLMDYKKLKGQFDRVVSIGMFEHVGYKNHRKYMKAVERVLKDDGLFLLHTIGNDISAVCGDAWINRYIFPNGMTPSMSQIAKSAENLFVMEDWENIGVHYDETLMRWYKRIQISWRTLMKNYDDRFHRMWSYYLLSCAGLFRARQAQVWQMVFSKKGVPGGYKPIRI